LHVSSRALLNSSRGWFKKRSAILVPVSEWNSSCKRKELKIVTDFAQSKTLFQGFTLKIYTHYYLIKPIYTHHIFTKAQVAANKEANNF